MDQVPLSIQDSVDRVGQIPANLAHPQPIRTAGSGFVGIAEDSFHPVSDSAGSTEAIQRDNTNENVQKQHATARKRDERDRNAQDGTLQNHRTGSEFAKVPA